MKAAIFEEHGGPEKILLKTIADPVPGPGEVVIQVKACALNHLDFWVLKGGPAYPVRLPHVLGCDVAGVVESVGPEVDALQPGIRVIIAPGLSCFQCHACRSGRDNLCESYSILGSKLWGGYAEKVKISASHLIPISDSLSFEDAAAFPLTFLTAWHMLIARAGLKRGDHVLVVGASSGVGSAAIQIAKHKGAKVLASVTSAEKVNLARSLGAEAVVNSNQESIAHVARAWTDRRGVDIVFEHVGPATWDQSVGSLAPGGKLVTCGATTGPEVRLDLRYLFARELALLGCRMGTRAELMEIIPLVSNKTLRPQIAKTFPLAEARSALEYMERRQHFGKILLAP